MSQLETGSVRRKLVVGDGIRGAPVAKQVAHPIREACGFEVDSSLQRLDSGCGRAMA